MSKYSPRITRNKHKQMKLAAGEEEPLTLDGNNNDALTGEAAVHRYAPSVDEIERLVEKQQAQEAAKTVQHALNETRATISHAVPAVTFASPASDDGLVFYGWDDTTNEIVEDLITLTRSNMKHLYDSAKDWTWSDTKKRGEFRDERMRFLVLRRVGKDAAPMPQSGLTHVVGFAAFRFSCEMSVPHVYVHEIQVLDKCRGMGIGKILMTSIEQIGLALDMHLVLLTCLVNNIAAMKFYTNLHYVVDEASPGPCFNLGAAASDPNKFAYQIMSKVLNPVVLKYKCELCSAFHCRFEDSLQQHCSYVHGVPWPFPCPYKERCKGGTVFAHQLQRHVEIVHQQQAENSSSPRPGTTALQLLSGGTSGGSGATIDSSDASSVGTSTTNTAGTRDYSFERVVFKSDGTHGTVVKKDDYGFYTVRLDGEGTRIVQCRPSAFEGHVVRKVVKRSHDPDWEFALKLQMEEGWARKSSRLKQ